VDLSLKNNEIRSIPLNLIEEDQDQPRQESNPGFSKQSLQELAESIRARGIKTPICVKNHPEKKGHFLLNDGARRLRAARMLNLDSVPAFVDNDFNSFDQLVVNLQRENNTPMEIATLIGRSLKQGMKQKDIARICGKSEGWVTIHRAFLNLPVVIRDALENKRLSDVNTAYELVKLYKTKPNEVTHWLSNPSQEITRNQLKLFQGFIASVKNTQTKETETAEPSEISLVPDTPEQELRETNAGSSDKIKKPIVVVEYNGKRAEFMLNTKPSAPGYAWLKRQEDGQVFEAILSAVSLVELLDGSS